MERQESFRLAVLLIWRAVRRDPLLDNPLLLVAYRQSSFALLGVPLPAHALIRTVSAIGFGRHFPHDPLVAVSVEQHSPFRAIQPAPFGLRRWVHTRALLGRRQKGLGELELHLASRCLGACTASRPLCDERAFELVILGCRQEQLVDRRRAVVHRRRADLHNATVRPDLIPRPELQTSLAVRINDDQMEAIRRYVDIDRLHLATIAASEQRRFAPALGQPKDGSDGQFPHGVGSSRAFGADQFRPANQGNGGGIHKAFLSAHSNGRRTAGQWAEPSGGSAWSGTLLEAAVRVEDGLPERFLCFECSIGGPKEQEIPPYSVHGVLPGGTRHASPRIVTLPGGEPDQREAAERAGMGCEDHLPSASVPGGLPRSVEMILTGTSSPSCLDVRALQACRGHERTAPAAFARVDMEPANRDSAWAIWRMRVYEHAIGRVVKSLGDAVTHLAPPVIRRAALGRSAGRAGSCRPARARSTGARSAHSIP